MTRRDVILAIQGAVVLVTGIATGLAASSAFEEQTIAVFTAVAGGFSLLGAFVANQLPRPQ